MPHTLAGLKVDGATARRDGRDGDRRSDRRQQSGEAHQGGRAEDFRYGADGNALGDRRYFRDQGQSRFFWRPADRRSGVWNLTPARSSRLPDDRHPLIAVVEPQVEQPRQDGRVQKAQPRAEIAQVADRAVELGPAAMLITFPDVLAATRGAFRSSAMLRLPLDPRRARGGSVIFLVKTPAGVVQHQLASSQVSRNTTPGNA